MLRPRGLLVRVRGDDGEPRWELVHDSLVPRVLAWIDRKDLARRRAIELVRYHLRRSRPDAPSLLGRAELRELRRHAAAIAELDDRVARDRGRGLDAVCALVATTRGRVRRRALLFGGRSIRWRIAAVAVIRSMDAADSDRRIEEQPTCARAGRGRARAVADATATSAASRSSSRRSTGTPMDRARSLSPRAIAEFHVEARTTRIRRIHDRPGTAVRCSPPGARGVEQARLTRARRGAGRSCDARRQRPRRRGEQLCAARSFRSRCRATHCARRPTRTSFASACRPALHRAGDDRDRRGPVHLREGWASRRPARSDPNRARARGSLCRRFAIDRTEVTNAAFEVFTEMAARTGIAGSRTIRTPLGIGELGRASTSRDVRVVDRARHVLCLPRQAAPDFRAVGPRTRGG